MKRCIVFILSLIISILSTATQVFADEPALYETTVTILLSDYSSFSPDKEIDVDGKKYELLNFEIIKENQQTFTVTEDKLQNKNYTASVTVTNPDDNSQKGTLVNTVFEESKDSNRKTSVSKTAKYTAVPLDYAIPQNLNTEYQDKETGQTVQAELKLTGNSKSSSYWIKSDDLKGSVTDYDALVYTLNNSNVQIPKNTNQPNYKGYESAILKSLGLDEDIYRITGAAWSGEAYSDSKGVTCRDCIYQAQMKVCDINAVYSAEINLPDKTTYSAISTYEDDANSTYDIKVTYQELPAKISPVVIAVGVILGILILSGLMAAILIYLSKKKNKETTSDNTIKFKNERN